MKTERSVPERCEIIQKVQRVLEGKWRIEILYYIGFQDIHRFGALRRHISGILELSLISQFRSLEEDGFISRHDYKEFPPGVEYSLTDLGQSFMPIMEHVKDWGETHLFPLSSSRQSLYPHLEQMQSLRSLPAGHGPVRKVQVRQLVRHRAKAIPVHILFIP